MATNEVYYPGDTLPLPVPAGTKSGDPVVIGTIAGVALEDRDTAGNAPVRVKGVFKLSVTGHDGSKNEAIGVGDKVYYTAPSGGTPAIINANASAGAEFGVALGAIASGADDAVVATIPVALKGGI